ncbi:MAG: JAB domain-containing protein [Lachnospiraceae bacterium]|nr:JAB domain-containing protein [Lachnospiraceae bacterium]
MKIDTYTTHINENGHNYLVKEKSLNYSSIKKFDSPAAVVEVMKNVFELDKLGEEHIFMISCNSACVPVGFFEVSHGVVNGSIIQPREVLIRALLTGSTSIIICHNHPSNCAVPSKQDENLTKRLKEACNLIGITLNDHIIICKDSYLSFKEANLI